MRARELERKRGSMCVCVCVCVRIIERKIKEKQVENRKKVKK